MSGYSSRPSAPMERAEAVSYLASEYGIPAGEARDLLTRATQRETGMASRPRKRPGEYTVWATHMTTLGGKFIIERE